MSIGKNPHQCANCNSYGSFTDKEGNQKNKLIWFKDSQHQMGGYYIRDETNDSNDDKIQYPCSNCADQLNYILNGNPYYGVHLSLDDNENTVISFISLEDCAFSRAEIFARRQHNFIESFKIQDWCAMFPTDLFNRTIQLYNIFYNFNDQY